MNQIVFNSFPRSGNVYQGAVSRHFFNTMQSQVHMPELFGVEDIYNVTVFRKPEDDIDSLIMKQSQSTSKINKDQIIKIASNESNTYKRYIEYAKKNKDIIYIGKFDNLITDTVKHFENISKKFNIELNKNYKENFLDAKLSGKLWDDRYDGHIPRPKDEVRLDIEAKVKELAFIQELNQEYNEFISHYATVV